MAAPSVTYSFTTGTSAQAGQVNTNFNDIISALTDSLKDLAIRNLTAAGTLNVTGVTTLGTANVTTSTITTATITTANVTTANIVDAVISDDCSVAGDFTISGSGAYSVTAGFANEVGDEMTSTGADLVGASMTATGADAIGSAMTATGANAVWTDVARTSGGATGGPRTVCLSGSSGFDSVASSTPTDITNCSVSFTASGSKIVEVWLIADGTANDGRIGVDTTTSDGTVSMNIRAMRGATVLDDITLGSTNNGPAVNFSVYSPLGILVSVDAPSAGTYTYKLQMSRALGDTAYCLYGRLYVKEI